MEVTLVWCDKLASTPTVGFAFDARLTPATKILDALAPVFDEWVREDFENLDFNIDKLDKFTLQVTSNTGFQYVVTPTRISVEFTHRLKVRPTSGGAPVAELTSTALPFTELLGEISRRLIKATQLLPNIETRTLRRIGVVSTTILDESVMPPGITRFIRYASRPWSGDVTNYSIFITSELRKTPKISEKCMHLLLKPEDTEEVPMIKFDWQRWFISGQAIRRGELEEKLENAKKSALAYFEDLAVGNRFDEDIINPSA